MHTRSDRRASDEVCAVKKARFVRLTRPGSPVGADLHCKYALKLPSGADAESEKFGIRGLMSKSPRSTSANEARGGKKGRVTLTN